MPALIYCRISTEQQTEGDSLDAQEKLCREFAAVEGLSVAEVFREQHSGAELWERPRLTALRERLRDPDVTHLICYAIDRLSRSIAHLMILVDECDRFDVKPLFITEKLDDSPEGRLMQSVRGYVGEVERIKIKERTVRGKRSRVENGRLINASTPLYGYSQSHETSARALHPTESKIVRRIWDDAFAGFGALNIAQKLNREAVASPGAGKRAYKDGRAPLWSKSTVLRILKEPAYAGLSVAFRWQSNKVKNKRRRVVSERPRDQWVILADDLTPAIVTQEEFDQMQILISNRTSGDAARNLTRPCLLRGLIFCGKCGRRREPDTSTYGYRCTSRGSAEGKCGSPATPMSVIEKWAWARMAERINDPAWLESLLQESPDEDSDGRKQAERVAELEAAIAKITGQQQRLILNLADVEGDLAGMFTAQVKRLETEKKTAKSELDALRRKAAAPGIARQELAAQIAEFQPLVATGELSMELQRRILLVFKIRVIADGKEGWRFDAGEALHL